MSVHRRAMCFLLAVLSTSAVADVLRLSEAKPGVGRSDSEETWCYYSKDGEASYTVLGTVSFSVTRQKPLLARILGRQSSTADLQAACPEAVNRYPEGPPKQETFNACVLQHVQSITSDLAAVAVRESCIRTSETLLPADALATLNNSKAGFWKSPFVDGGSGLYLSVNNNSGYSITELVIVVVDKKTKAVERYSVRSFPAATAGVAILGYPKDPAVWLMIPPGVRTFYTSIRQATSDLTKWHEAFDWAIISAKGFRD